MTLDEKIYSLTYYNLPLNIDVAVVASTEDERILEIHCLNLTKKQASAFVNGSDTVTIRSGPTDSVIALYKKFKDNTNLYDGTDYKKRELHYELLPTR